MGSIFNLLNPVSNPSPQRIYSPKRKRRSPEEEAERGQSAVLNLDANAECRETELHVKTTKGNDLDDHTAADGGGSAEMMEETAPTVSSGDAETNVDASPHELTSENYLRRTSSNSLADILNPVEPALDVSKPSTEPLHATSSISHAAAPNLNSKPLPSETIHVEPARSSTQPKPAPGEECENDEDMVVDVVGFDEESGENPGLTATDTLQTGPPMQRLKSTDSERTITDPVDYAHSTATKSSSPAGSPGSSKKRKFTPDPSPEQPLSKDVPAQTKPSAGIEVEPEITVVKPESISCSGKKPKKANVKKPQGAKKKNVATSQKKPVRPKLWKEKSGSVGFDTSTSTRQSSVSPSVASYSSCESSDRPSSKQLYCICHKPDQGTWMINCELCNDWFHGACISLDESDEPLIETYVCPVCTGEGKGKTSWIPKCRLEGCKNPALQAVKTGKSGKGVQASKYCGDEHAVLFFKNKLKDLDVETITRSQLKTLVNGVSSADEFQELGEIEPTVPEEILVKYKSPDDDSRLADIRLEREKINRKLDIVHLRQTFLHLAVEKGKQLNADLKTSVPQQLTVKKSKTKPKEICAFDERLSLDDATFLEWTASDQGKKILTERRIDSGGECTAEKRRCRHAGWQALRGEDILMEEESLRSQLDGITREERTIRETQKVRARDSSPSNGRAIAITEPHQ